MNWTDIGVSAIVSKGFPLPQNPTDAFCFELGMAQAMGYISKADADTILALQPAQSQPFRDRGFTVMTSKQP